MSKRKKAKRTVPVWKQAGFRSRFEYDVYNDNPQLDKALHYETTTLPYTMTLTRKYKPDVLLPNGVVVELKGYFRTADEKHKLLALKASGYDVRLLFQSANVKLVGAKAMTHEQWCEKHGFQYAIGSQIPESWLE